MENEQNFKLIEGIFHPLEAQKLLMEMINTKINFHNLDAFSNHIRFNTSISNSKSRVNELNETAEKIKSLIQYAQANNLELEIKSNISITLKMFDNRKLVIATKHHKESVIATLFENELGVKCFVPNDFDTDLLGTFSGEIERKDSAVDTVKKKCLLAMEQTNCDLGIASEGSFGPHPILFMASANEELLVL